MKTLQDIVFLGSPDFALPSLRRLVSAGYNVLAVYTQPDRPVGRGRSPQAPAVKLAAQALGLTVRQPERLADAAATEALAALKPDALVVAAYGQIIPAAWLAAAPWGALHLHPSLLPRHRGAGPVAATILHGDTFGGVSLMQLDAGLDTGPVHAQVAVTVGETETTPRLTAKLAVIGAQLLHEVLLGLPRGAPPPRPQEDAQATYFPALTRQQGQIDWTRPAAEIARQVRAFLPWPGSYTYWQGKKLEIMAARPLPDDTGMAPGTVIPASPEMALDDLPGAVQTGAGRLGLLEVKLAGQRALDGAAFMRGQRDFSGSLLTGGA